MKFILVYCAVDETRAIGTIFLAAEDSYSSNDGTFTSAFLA
jgi:hypothetical protein